MLLIFCRSPRRILLGGAGSRSRVQVLPSRSGQFSSLNNIILTDKSFLISSTLTSFLTSLGQVLMFMRIPPAPQTKLYCLILYYKMEQQLILSTIEILPATMEDVLSKLQSLLASPSIEQEHILANIIKSLFYGVWNFDKMINQHNLNTKISELLLKLPKKNAIIFLKAILKHLYEKWNLIDHHRINKFMQLVRYLIGQSFKFCEKHKTSKKKLDAVLHECIFDEQLPINGLVFHVIDIYFELCQQNISQPVTLQDLAIFQELLVKHTSEHVRLYIAEHVYEKYKDYLIQTYGGDLEQLEQKVQDFAAHFLELAKKEEKELHRKNLYAIVGYAKSEELSFAIYLKQKREKALAEQQKKKKKLTKAKKQQIRQLKEKRKQKKKGGKKTKKIMSAGKFQAGVRTKKGIEEL